MFCLVYVFLRQNPDLNLRNISNCKNAMELEFMSKSSKRVKTNCISLKWLLHHVIYHVMVVVQVWIDVSMKRVTSDF